MGMINVFKNYFQLLRFKYFADDDYKREIDYEDLSDCFVYPAKADLSFEHVEQRTIDMIYEISKNSTDATVSEQYRIVRIGA